MVWVGIIMCGPSITFLQFRLADGRDCTYNCELSASIVLSFVTMNVFYIESGHLC